MNGQFRENQKNHKYLNILLPAFVGLLGMLVVFLLSPNFRASRAGTPEFKNTFPRLTSMYLEWEIPASAVESLAKFDLLILDMETQKRSPENIKKIRALNQKIKIVAYITSEEIRDDARNLGRANAPMRSALLDGIKDGWWLKGAGGEGVSFWPGTHMLNVTDGVSGDSRWNEYLPLFVSKEIMSSGLWDGVFYDNTFDNITAMVGDNLDLDRNGFSDAPDKINESWRAGMIKIFTRTRSLIGADKLIMGNGGTSYAPFVNGRLFENFGVNNWEWEEASYKKVATSAAAPRIAVINSNTANTGRKDDWQKFRFGLGSALLFDGFYSFDDGDAHHNQIWWYDEYNVSLGSPTGDAYNVLDKSANLRAGLWRRDFRNGIILVNSSDEIKTAALEGEYERLRGAQDPGTNSGEINSIFTVPAKDALVLLRPINSLPGASFLNGAYVRVFSGDGSSARRGFFVYDAAYRGGADVNVYKNYQAVSSGGEIVILKDGREEARFWPYGENYTGKVSIALVDLGSDAVPEIAALNQEGDVPQIKVLRLNGSFIKYYYPYGKNGTTRGGSVAATDMDGAERAEIILGAPRGARPEVKIYDTDFNLLRSFRVYDPGFKGGVNVAVGDLEGDGKKEIITGAASLGGPHVRVWNQYGREVFPGFFAFSAKLRSGVVVSAFDVDGDGKDEIITMSNAVFTTK